MHVPREYSEYTDEWSDVESQVFLESLIYYSAMESKEIQRAIDSSLDQKVEDKPLPDHIRNKLRKGKCVSVGDGCAICQDIYALRDECIYLSCGHIYHCQCILEWFNRQSTCPCCRVMVK
jgi:hypothetical protein